MRLLDLFCGAGGCAVGYHRAGFTEIVGVDIAPMPRYPFEFVQRDALEYVAEHGHEFDVIHASPPCQAYSATRHMHGNEHPDLVAPVRELVRAAERPYVIENVPGAPLRNYLMLCGTMFGLRTIRHRLFECSPTLFFPPATCNHWGRTGESMGRYRSFDNSDFISPAGDSYRKADAEKSVGIDWMTKRELNQAIPPAYTEYIGRKLLEAI